MVSHGFRRNAVSGDEMDRRLGGGRDSECRCGRLWERGRMRGRGYRS